MFDILLNLCFSCFFKMSMWKNQAIQLEQWTQRLLLWSQNCSASGGTWIHTNRTGSSSGKLLNRELHLEHLITNEKIYHWLSLWSCRAWKKLKEVLQRWIETTGRDDQSEKSAVCQELKEARYFVPLCWKPSPKKYLLESCRPKYANLFCCNEGDEELRFALFNSVLRCRWTVISKSH